MHVLCLFSVVLLGYPTPSLPSQDFDRLLSAGFGKLAISRVYGSSSMHSAMGSFFSGELKAWHVGGCYPADRFAYWFEARGSLRLGAVISFFPSCHIRRITKF